MPHVWHNWRHSDSDPILILNTYTNISCEVLVFDLYYQNRWKYFMFCVSACPPNYAQYGKKCYHYSPAAYTWTEADIVCKAHSQAWVGEAYLAKLHNIQITEFINSLLQG